MLCRGKKKRKLHLAILLPVVLTISLLINGTVFANDSVAPETPEEEVQESSSTSSEEAADNSPVDEPDSEESQNSEDSNDEFTDDQQSTENNDETSNPSDETDKTQGEEENGDDQSTPESQEEPAAEEAQDESSGEENNSEEEETPESGDETESNTNEAQEEDTEPTEDEVALVNENGEILDMASEESQEIISSADPWWIVSGVKYAYVKTGGSCPGDADHCFESDTPIQSALDYMSANNLSPSDGLLHVEADSYTEDISVDGNLVFLKGIISEGSSIDTIITGTVSISNTTKGFTLRGFTIFGSLSLSDNIGTVTLEDVVVESSSSTGISIKKHKGAVKINRVAADNNSEYGLYIDNSYGTSSVTISNSQFQFNQGGPNTSGLYIKTNNKITLKGVSVFGNTGSGAILNALKGTFISQSVFSNNTYQGVYIENTYTSNAVTITDTLINNNGYEGLYLFTGGKVVLDNVTVTGNGNGDERNGATINTQAGNRATIKVINSIFSGNYDYGLHINAINNVTISGITADSNMNGIFIDTCFFNNGTCQGTGKVIISNKQQNSISNNSHQALYILANNTVTLKNIDSTGNGSGLYIDNSRGNRKKISITNGNFSNSTNLYGIDIMSSGKVTLVNVLANDNNSFGIQIETLGAVILKNISANSNGGVGLSVDNCQENGGCTSNAAVKIYGSANDFNNNGNDGVVIITGGKVTIINISADSNSGNYGMRVDQSNSSGSPSVKIRASKNYTNSFTNNNRNGLFIWSPGNVSLVNIAADGNGDSGLFITANGKVTITNASNDNSSQGIRIINNGHGKSVTLTNIKSSNTNGIGIEISAFGNVSLKNITSNGNGETGIEIKNCMTDDTCSGKITLTNVAASQNTASHGVYIESKGNVLIKNLTTEDNGQTGLFVNTTGKIIISKAASNGNAFGMALYNNNSSNNAGIRISYTESSNNTHNHGLRINTKGSVSLMNITSNSNAGSGLELDNCQKNGGFCASSASVKIYGSANNFNDNGNDGVHIETGGKVTIMNISASSNGGYGLQMDNCQENGSCTSNAAVKIYGSANDFNNNGSNGVDIITGGKITIINISADSNGGDYGMQVNQFLSSGSPSVKIRASKNYTNSFTNNNRNGLFIWSPGNVSLVNIAADGNGDSGLFIITEGKVTITNASNNNSSQGIHIINNGHGKSVTLTNIESSNTNGIGVEIWAFGNVSLKNITSNGNGENGIEIKSCMTDDTCSGKITLTNVTASQNTVNHGVYIESKGNVLIKNLTTEDNGQTGLFVNTIGKIIISKATSNGNAFGMALYNYTSSNNAGIRISYTESSNNTYDFGISINTKGSVSLMNITSNSNAGRGLFVDNHHGDTIDRINTASVKIYGSANNFNGNGSDGVKIVSGGKVTIMNINANSNGGYGLQVDNRRESGGRTRNTAVKIYGNANNFNNNGSDGVNIVSDGKVTMINTSANSNSGYFGIFIDASGFVNLSKINTNGNFRNGLSLYRVSNASLYKVQSCLNGDDTNDGDGLILIVNDGATVKITYSVFSTNYGSGIEINGNMVPNLYKTYYFGNDINNNGDSNLNLLT